MRLFYDATISDTDNSFTLSESESKHLVRVLRMKEGDRIGLLNGQGGAFTCEITLAHHKKCEVAIIEKEQHTHQSHSIHIALCATKQLDRIEWFIEKATEIGISEISFLTTKNAERSSVKLDRLEKKAISAMKQSKQFFLPKINPPIDFSRFIASHQNGLLAHCYDTDKQPFEKSFQPNNCPILIGPEGDFTEAEIQLALDNGYKTITLGKNRLRTETAALYACMRAKLYLDLL